MKDKTTNQVRIQLARCVSPTWLRLLVILAVLGSAGMAQAAERVAQTSADLPFYARIGRGEIYHDGEWAAIAFYRPPACVPTGFNLLDFMDIPAAFGCGDPARPYLIGFGIFEGDAPIQSKLQLAPDQTIPVWFVRWSELEAAVADDNLTIAELAALPSGVLRGEATFYTETLHPAGAAQQTMISIVTSGFLADGRKFIYQATGTKEENRLNHVKIEFK
jgi:hypothetical protein